MAGINCKIDLDTLKVSKKIKKLTKSFEKLSLSLEKLNLELQYLKNIEIGFQFIEIKKKWYQFWK